MMLISAGISNSTRLTMIHMNIFGHIRLKCRHWKRVKDEPRFILSLYKTHMVHRTEEHKSELQAHSEISYAVICLKKKKKRKKKNKVLDPSPTDMITGPGRNNYKTTV